LVVGVTHDLSALRRDDPAFIDTLDYIFVSRRCEVLDVLPLPDLAVSKRAGPQPTVEQPSDHLLLAASIRFPITRGFGTSKLQGRGAPRGPGSRGGYLGKKPRKMGYSSAGKQRRPKAVRKRGGRYKPKPP
jgi:hypothetical protein